jgi:hypothetical protein
MLSPRDTKKERSLLQGYKNGLYGPLPLVHYARQHIGRWQEAEDLISQNIPQYGEEAIFYARTVIRGRWQEVEPALMRTPYYINRYARSVLKGRWREAEPTLLQCPTAAVEYASRVLRGRWSEAEKVIVVDPAAAAAYAHEILNKRWPDAEVHIGKSGRSATVYAINVLKDRWAVAEEAILRDGPIMAGKALLDYASTFYAGRDRWQEAEDVFVSSYPEWYAENILPSQWDEEVAKKCPCWLYYYAKDVIGGRLPEELHNRMLLFGMENPDDPWVNKYCGAKKYQRRPRHSANHHP